MTTARPSIVILAFLLLFAPSASAAWDEDYEAGIAAARRGDWGTVVTRMNAAIRQKAQEGARVRSYGNIFIAYFPYYYRGVAYFEQGNFDRAAEDLERTKGVGSLDLGTVDSYLRKIPAAATPTPAVIRTPPPTPVVTSTRTTTPTPIRIDPPPPTPPPQTPRPSPGSTPYVPTTSERQAEQRARSLINQANAAMSTARQRRAESLARPQFSTGLTQLSQAQTRAVNARSEADWRRVADAAEAARLQFEQATQIAANPQINPEEIILAETKRRIRGALDSYFSGRFSEASALFGSLARENQNNAFLWAFFGASRYSEYYIDGERNEAMKRESEAAFRQARKLRMSELPAAYFSPRIRRFFALVR